MRRGIVRAFLIVTLAVVAAGPGWLSARAAGDGYVGGIEDLPLMPGLSAAPDADVVFDSPAGRIVEATAGGPLTEAAIRAFYADTLPQLGWTPREAGAFGREGELLRIEITVESRRPPRSAVRFFLSPAAADGAR